MDIGKLARRYLLGWTVLSFGGGAAVAVALLGVPKLWTAEAAGWASAVTTFAAVVVALVTAHRQLVHAQAAVAAERVTAEQVQEREWDVAERERLFTTMRLAFAFSRELSYARRKLVSRLLEWEPSRIAEGDDDVIQAFSERKPLGDLDLIKTFANRLEGFSDEDAFLLLTILSTWQFFNGPPATTARELAAVQPHVRVEIAKGRLIFGFELVDAIDRGINTLAKYYEHHSSIVGSVSQEVPEQAAAQLRRIREAL